MTIATNDLAAIAAGVEAKPSKLLTTSNPKTAKGEGYGYLTAILHLAPHKASGANLCSDATAGCAAACLNTAGRGGFDLRIQEARIRKSKWFRADRQAFMLRLEREIRAHIRNARRHGLEPCVRLNGTSDIPWESVRFESSSGARATLFELYPNVQFYDYTKSALRFGKSLPANYDLTMSAADGNERAVEYAQSFGARVAVVFRNKRRPKAQARYWSLPKSYKGRKLVDADRHDLRFLEPKGVICGLKAKGSAVLDTTGFVREIVPARG
jgi:hypothetical protein